jgi:hypothetical protein
LCLAATSAQADPTICGFSGVGTDTPYFDNQFGAAPIGMAMPTKGQPSGFFYRLGYDNMGSLNNTIAFDQTDVNPATMVVVDFDFRIGKASDSPSANSTPADGMGFALLNTNIARNSFTGVTSAGGNPVISDAGVPLTEEASEATYSVSVGLDTYANAYDERAVGSNPIGGAFLNASNNNIKIAFNGVFNDLGTPSHGSGTLGNNRQSGCVYKFSQDIGSNGGSTYQMSRVSKFNTAQYNDMQPWDHFHMVLDLLGQTATVTITPSADLNLTPFSIFSAISMPCLSPYPMRAEFAARTGGAYSNEDIANVNIVFTP